MDKNLDEILIWGSVINHFNGKEEFIGIYLSNNREIFKQKSNYQEEQLQQMEFFLGFLDEPEKENYYSKIKKFYSIKEIITFCEKNISIGRNLDHLEALSELEIKAKEYRESKNPDHLISNYIKPEFEVYHKDIPGINIVKFVKFYFLNQAKEKLSVNDFITMRKIKQDYDLFFSGSGYETQAENIFRNYLINEEYTQRLANMMLLKIGATRAGDTDLLTNVNNCLKQLITGKHPMTIDFSRVENIYQQYLK